MLTNLTRNFVSGKAYFYSFEVLAFERMGSNNPSISENYSPSNSRTRKPKKRKKR